MAVEVWGRIQNVWKQQSHYWSFLKNCQVSASEVLSVLPQDTISWLLSVLRTICVAGLHSLI